MMDIFLPTCRWGTVFGPVGTSAGGFLGGLVGGVTGAIVGDKVIGEAAGEAAGAATNAIHSTGTTIKSGTNSTIKWVGSWVGWYPLKRFILYLKKKKVV